MGDAHGSVACCATKLAHFIAEPIGDVRVGDGAPETAHKNCNSDDEASAKDKSKNLINVHRYPQSQLPILGGQTSISMEGLGVSFGSKRKVIVGASLLLCVPDAANTRCRGNCLHSVVPGLPNAGFDVAALEVQILLTTKI